MFGLIWRDHGMNTVTHSNADWGVNFSESQTVSHGILHRPASVIAKMFSEPLKKWLLASMLIHYIFLNTLSIGNLIYTCNTAILARVQVPQTCSVCPGVKSRTTQMKSGNWCILLYCMTRNAMKWSFCWGSCKQRRMPSIRFL